MTARAPVCHPERKHKAKGLCFACYDKLQYHRDPKAKVAKHKRWSEANREHLRQYRREWGKRNPIKKVFLALKANASKRGIPFALTVDDLAAVWTDRCPVLGIPIKANTVRSFDSLSVDRIDNSVGYVPGNICVISNRANALKNDATVAELEAVLAYMRKPLPSAK